MRSSRKRGHRITATFCGLVLASTLLVLTPGAASAHHGGVCWASSRNVGYTNGVHDIYAQWAMSCHRQVYRIRMNYWAMDCGTFKKPDCYSGQYVGGTAHFLWDERFNASFFSKQLVVSENFPGSRWYCAESYATIELTKGGDVEKIPGGGEEANCKKL